MDHDKCTSTGCAHGGMPTSAGLGLPRPQVGTFWSIGENACTARSTRIPVHKRADVMIGGKGRFLKSVSSTCR